MLDVLTYDRDATLKSAWKKPQSRLRHLVCFSGGVVHTAVDVDVDSKGQLIRQFTHGMEIGV